MSAPLIAASHGPGRQRPVRIGILGGSFNPPHLGHLLLASFAHDQLGLDLVLLVPAWSPPHKHIADDVAAAVRLDLARAAVDGDDRLEVSDVEIRLRLRYTIDTLYALRDEHPGAELWFLAGADSLVAFTTWRDPAGILEVCRLAVVPRPGASRDEAEAARSELAGVAGEDRIELVDMPEIALSSTMLRDRVRAGRSIRHAVPPAVDAAVARLGLYVPRPDAPAGAGDPASAAAAGPASGLSGAGRGSIAAGPRDAEPTAGPSVAEAEQLMAARVGPDLYAHCVRVARYAADLATRWGASPQEAELAGLLHDYWREGDAETVLRRCRDLGVAPSELELRRPVQLLHARLAAAEAQAMGVPLRVCAAIARHTVGGAGMTTLEKCLYVADAAEPARDYHDVDDLRELARTDLDEAVAWSNRRGIAQLLQKGRPIHPDSLALYNEGS